MKSSDLREWAEENLTRRTQQVKFKKELITAYQRLIKETEQLKSDLDRLMAKFTETKI